MELNELIEVNIYLCSKYVENNKCEKRNEYKKYHLYFIIGQKDKIDGLVEEENNSELNDFKKMIYISNKKCLKKDCLKYKELLVFLQIVLTYRFSAKHKIRLIKNT
ncbi:MAG: hypothetical protein KH215_03270 [Coprobacillus sp.]|nr:hypothetical protein [Coprobacillus sp.]